MGAPSPSELSSRLGARAIISVPASPQKGSKMVPQELPGEALAGIEALWDAALGGHFGSSWGVFGSSMGHLGLGLGQRDMQGGTRSVLTANSFGLGCKTIPPGNPGYPILSIYPDHGPLLGTPPTRAGGQDDGS